jgi:hypothetical protein
VKLKEYLDKINAKVAENPEILNYSLVYSKDDEGNGFKKVFYPPSIGYYDSCDGEFVGTEDNELVPNAICIN